MMPFLVVQTHNIFFLHGTHPCSIQGILSLLLTLIFSVDAALASQLNFKVVAEGVETLAEKLFLYDRGCHYFQGYLISPPILAKDWPAFLNRMEPERLAP
jgi:c-di-GMP-related signal transduction protein